MSEDGINPNYVKCADCNHVWIGFYLPQPMAGMAKALKHMFCPKCLASSKRILINVATEDIQKIPQPMSIERAREIVEPLFKNGVVVMRGDENETRVITSGLLTAYQLEAIARVMR